MKIKIPISFLKAFCEVETEKKMPVLSFDDGPFVQTPAILDTLKRHVAKAAFLMIGRNISGDESAPRIHYSIEIVRHLRTSSQAHVILGGSGFPLQPETMLNLDVEVTSSVMYGAPGLSPDWLDRIPKSGFTGIKFCIYPPRPRNEQLKKIHRFGYVKLKRLQFMKDSS